MYRYSISLALVIVAIQAHGQIKPLSKQPSERPIAVVERVAKRVIAHTPFAYRLTLPQISAKFDFIKSVDLGRTFPQALAGDGAYIYTELYAKRDTSIELEMSYGGTLTLWLEGKEVYSGKEPLTFSAIQKEREFVLSKSISIAIKAGANRLMLLAAAPVSGPWKIYLQPKGGLIEFSPVVGLELGLQRNQRIDGRLAETSSFLVCGPFRPGGGAAKPSPEKALEVGSLYSTLGQPTSWSLPKVDVFADIIDGHPLWGTFYNYNYHAAGLAWSMANLSLYTGKPEYAAHAARYCDFMLETRPFIAQQVLGQDGFRSVQHHLINTPLLDFSTAPAMPFAQRLISEASFAGREKYVRWVDSIADYALYKQIRLPDGTYTRETPEKYTTWVDDMFMGIPFLVYSSKAVADKAKREKLLAEAAKQVLLFNKHVFDEKNNLYYHAQYSSRQAAIPHWARANGWGIFATSVVLEALPSSHPSYKAILKYYTRHAEKIASLQAKSGFWHQIIDDPASYEETSATAIFTMAIARGVNRGWLPSKYRANALLGWQALQSKIDPDGTVHGICVGTMSSETVEYYKERPTADNDSHGLLGLIWTGIEMDKLVGK